MIWRMAARNDPRCCALADRHYSRQKIGTDQFMPPAGCVVLYAGSPTGGQAVWGVSTPLPEWVKHDWAGAWTCSIFRNEGAGRASDLIVQAVAATRAAAMARPHLPSDAPPLGIMTFIDRSKVRPTMVRGVPVWGWTFRKAGFREAGETKGGLLALQLVPSDMPRAVAPHGMQYDLFAGLPSGETFA